MKEHISTWSAIFLLAFMGVGMGHAQIGGEEAPEDLQAAATFTSLSLFPQLSQQDSSEQPTDETVPMPLLSGLDESDAGSGRGETRSFVLPGVHLSQSVGSNLGGDGGDLNFHGVTRVLGSLELQRLRKRSEMTLGYIGGIAHYSNAQKGEPQLHELRAEQKFLWRKGQLAIRDAFSYLPEGSFGYGAFGGAGGFGLGSFIGGGGLGGGSGIFFGSGQFGSLGNQPRINNVAVADVTEVLSARSAATFAVGYGFSHFLENSDGLINSRQVSLQAGYNYRLNRSDEVAVVYGHQSFRYPVSFAGDFSTNLVQVMYGHRISGRMQLVVGAGPQITVIDNPFFGEMRRWSVSGRASLQYQLPRTTLNLTYHRYTTSGSGFFAGSNSDVARISAAHPLNRLWHVTVDAGYAHNSRIQPSLAGIDALSYQFGHAGVAVHRQLGRHLSAFFGYHFSDVNFDNSVCSPTANCGRMSLRHAATFGLDWHPRALRLD